MRRNFVGVVVFAMLVGSSGLAQMTKPRKDAVAELEHIPYFAFGGVGIAGVTSVGEIDFRAIIAQDPVSALRQFEQIYAQGNIEAKCYALVAIRRLNPGRFRELAKTPLPAESVHTMRGCIADFEKTTDVQSEIARGAFDILAFSSRGR